MAFPNSSVTDIVATTLEHRSGKITDNIIGSNALLARLSEKGKVKPFSGGRLIYEELAFAENGNAGWYSGYDALPTSAADVLSAAEFSIKQAACPVVVSGLEMLQNGGKEQLIDLLEARIGVAEATMKNLVNTGLYSDGTGTGGKQITGLAAAVPTNGATGTYGGIDRSAYTFWRPLTSTGNGAETSSTIQGSMNALYLQLCMGSDVPDLVVSDNVCFTRYLASLQSLQRFSDSKLGQLGFQSVKYMGADVVLDGGIGADCTANTMFMLNTNYLHFRPHKDRNFIPLSPQKRYSTNQDAEVQILAWAGNLTCSAQRHQGRLTITPA